MMHVLMRLPFLLILQYVDGSNAKWGISLKGAYLNQVKLQITVFAL